MDPSVQQQGEQTVAGWVLSVGSVQTSHFDAASDAPGGFEHPPHSRSVPGRARTVPVWECLQSGCFLLLGSVVCPIKATVNKDKNSSMKEQQREREKNARLNTVMIRQADVKVHGLSSPSSSFLVEP